MDSAVLIQRNKTTASFAVLLKVTTTNNTRQNHVYSLIRSTVETLKQTEVVPGFSGLTASVSRRLVAQTVLQLTESWICGKPASAQVAPLFCSRSIVQHLLHNEPLNDSDMLNLGDCQF